MKYHLTEKLAEQLKCKETETVQFQFFKASEVIKHQNSVVWVLKNIRYGLQKLFRLVARLLI